MNAKILHLDGISVNEIGLSIEIDGVIYSGCLSEVQADEEVEK